MKTQIKSGIFGLFVAITCLSCETKMPLSTVKYVDLGRYSGTWYEIASYPQFFERGCTHVKATYTAKDSFIEVLNQSIKNGSPNDIKGKAFDVKNTGNAKLKVQFFWPFRGDYWIIDLASDYSWAVVSDPKRNTLWILSRTPKLDELLYKTLIEKLEKNGFEKIKIVKMVQE